MIENPIIALIVLLAMIAFVIKSVNLMDHKEDSYWESNYYD